MVTLKRNVGWKLPSFWEHRCTGDLETNDILVNENVFSVVDKMLKNCRPQVCAHLLKVVGADSPVHRSSFTQRAHFERLAGFTAPGSTTTGEQQGNSKKTFKASLKAAASRRSDHSS